MGLAASYRSQRFRATEAPTAIAMSIIYLNEESELEDELEELEDATEFGELGGAGVEVLEGDVGLVHRTAPSRRRISREGFCRNPSGILPNC